MPFEENIVPLQVFKNKKIGIFLEVQDIEFYHLSLEYIEDFDDEFEFFFYFTQKIWQEEIEYKNITLLSNFHFFIDDKFPTEFANVKNNILSQMYKFDYICFLPDYRKIFVNTTKALLKTQRYCLMENLLKSKVYVQNVLSLFLEDKEISTIYPTEPFCLEYLQLRKTFMKRSLNKNGISIFQIACWIRMENIVDNGKKVIEVHNNEYAALYLDNLDYFMRKLEL